MVSEILYELLVSSMVVIHRLQSKQPFELLFCPSADFWSFDACESNGNPSYEGG